MRPCNLASSTTWQINHTNTHTHTRSCLRAPIKSRLRLQPHNLVDVRTRSTQLHVQEVFFILFFFIWISRSHSNRSFPSNRKSSKEESHAASEQLRQVVLHRPRFTDTHIITTMLIFRSAYPRKHCHLRRQWEEFSGRRRQQWWESLDRWLEGSCSWQAAQPQNLLIPLVPCVTSARRATRWRLRVTLRCRAVFFHVRRRGCVSLSLLREQLKGSILFLIVTVEWFYLWYDTHDSIVSKWQWYVWVYIYFLQITLYTLYKYLYIDTHIHTVHMSCCHVIGWLSG